MQICKIGESMLKLYLYGLGAWVILLILAIINAVIRETVYAPKIGELPAHQISSIVFICVIFLFTYIFLKIVNIEATGTQYLMLGIMWLILTVAFEFLFGHYIVGHSWSKLLTDYNILEGRLWGIVLLTLTIAPWLINKLNI